MESFQNLAKKPTLKKQIIEQAFDLKCENCGRKYDYYKFDDGSEFKHGCDCEMIEYAKQSTENYHRKNRRRKAERIFKQSIMNEDLTKAMFDNYNPTNEQLEYAKNLCERYANNFTLDNKQSLLIQGSFGTGKSHLSMSIVKSVIAVWLL